MALDLTWCLYRGSLDMLHTAATNAICSSSSYRSAVDVVAGVNDSSSMDACRWSGYHITDRALACRCRSTPIVACFPHTAIAPQSSTNNTSRSCLAVRYADTRQCRKTSWRRPPADQKIPRCRRCRQCQRSMRWRSCSGFIICASTTHSLQWRRWISPTARFMSFS